MYCNLSQGENQKIFSFAENYDKVDHSFKFHITSELKNKQYSKNEKYFIPVLVLDNLLTNNQSTKLQQYMQW
jgi:hypothetical protein